MPDETVAVGVKEKLKVVLAWTLVLARVGLVPVKLAIFQWEGVYYK